MKKIKYYYNTHSLRYEKLETPLRVKLLRIIGFIAASLVTSAIISYLAFQFVGSPAERILRAENERLATRYQDLRKQISELQLQMSELEKRDNEVYRSIFEAEPLPDSARAVALEKQKEAALVANMGDDQLVRSIQQNLRKLANRIE